MENEKNVEKKVYETPVVTKVEFDASDRITASGCDELFDELGPCSFM